MSENLLTSGNPFPAKTPPATTVSVVLLVENDVIERGSKAAHLRASGFAVIEAEDGEAARRVLGSVAVNVVFVDISMSDPMDGLALLRWLREHHPSVEVISTSATEENIPSDGFGIFLSKPYRLVDLDFCLRKVLATSNIPSNQTGNAITADPRKTVSPDLVKAQPASARPNSAAGPEAVGRDAVCKPAITELSRRLAERVARQRAVDPAAAKAPRRAALEAYDLARTRRRRWALGFAMGGIVGSAIVCLVPWMGLRAVPPSSNAALPQPPPALSMAVATPIPALLDSVSPEPSPPPFQATNAAYAPDVASMATQAAPPVDAQQVHVEPVKNQVPLGRDEAIEIQARLRSFGFNPGPVDGDPGAMTEGAIRRYQQNRGQPQTGSADRELLERLRNDPKPKIVQRIAGQYARPASSLEPRRTNPFEFVRSAGDRFGQWLDAKLR